jgi:hypothetical protein
MFNLNTNNYEVGDVLKSLNYTKKGGCMSDRIIPMMIIAVIVYVLFEMFSNRTIISAKENETAECKQCSNKDDLNKLILKYESENFETLFKKK